MIETEHCLLGLIAWAQNDGRVVSEHDWGARAVQCGNRKPWEAKVQGAAVRYGLRDSLIAIRTGLLTLAEMVIAGRYNYSRQHSRRLEE